MEKGSTSKEYDLVEDSQDSARCVVVEGRRGRSSIRSQKAKSALAVKKNAGLRSRSIRIKKVTPNRNSKVMKKDIKLLIKLKSRKTNCKKLESHCS